MLSRVLWALAQIACLYIMQSTCLQAVTHPSKNEARSRTNSSLIEIKALSNTPNNQSEAADLRDTNYVALSHRQTSSKSVVIDYSTAVDNVPYFVACIVIGQQTRLVLFKRAHKRRPPCNSMLEITRYKLFWLSSRQKFCIFSLLQKQTTVK